MPRQLGLFRGIELSEDQIEAIVSPIYPQLWSMIRGPFEDLLSRRIDDPAFRIMDEGETAQWLRPQIVSWARVLFEGNPDVSIEKRRGQLRIKVGNQIAITPKKFRRRWMDKGLTFSSYETDQNRLYWHQRQVAGIDDLPRIIVGYKFLAEMTDIKILVAFPQGKHLVLCYPMPEQMATSLNVIRGTVRVWQATEQQDRGFVVLPKKAGDEKGAG